MDALVSNEVEVGDGTYEGLQHRLDFTHPRDAPVATPFRLWVYGNRC